MSVILLQLSPVLVLSLLKVRKLKSSVDLNILIFKVCKVIVGSKLNVFAKITAIET